VKYDQKLVKKKAIKIHVLTVCIMTVSKVYICTILIQMLAVQDFGNTLLEMPSFLFVSTLQNSLPKWVLERKI
jgi:hypothetical protein